MDMRSQIDVLGLGIGIRKTKKCSIRIFKAENKAFCSFIKAIFANFKDCIFICCLVLSNF